MGDLTTNLLSAVAGGVATWLVSWWTRRTATLGHWGAFLAELEICRDAAAAFLADEVQAPLGRLPMMAFNRAFPILIENGRMRPSQVRALTELYSVADWKNRSLEPTQSYVAGPLRDDGLLLAEYKRLRVKAVHISGDKYELARSEFLRGPRMRFGGTLPAVDAQ